MKINRHILDNGLRLVHSQDESTQMVALNILYKVGARDEHPEHTGFAHLFEHLMFGGSVNIPDYDMPLQLAGGENNAWTNNDITNYYPHCSPPECGNRLLAGVRPYAEPRFQRTESGSATGSGNGRV